MASPDNRRISVASERGRTHGLQPRELSAAGVVGIGYYAGVHAGMALTFASSPVSILWPPNAILLAALLLTPPRLWWLMLLAVLPAHFAAEIGLGVPVAMAALWFVSNVFEALLGAVVILKLLERQPRLDSVRDLSVFLLAGVVLAPLLSSFLDAASVALVGWRYSGYWEVWRIRFFSNALATLILVPLIVTWFGGGIESLRRMTLIEFSELAAFLAALCITSAAVFHDSLHLGPFAMYPYLPLPFLIWASVRWGVSGVAPCAAIIAGFALTGVLDGRGPFASAAPLGAALTVQTFLMVVGSSFLLLAASLTELRQARKVAARQEERLNLALDAAEMGTWEWDFARELITWRSASPAMVRTEVVSRSRSPASLLGFVHENDRDMLRRAIDDVRKKGGSGEIEFRFIDRRGSHRWLTIKGRVQADVRGAPQRMIGVYIDTTQRKSQEMLARAQREQLAHLGRVSTLGELSGAIAHELNQPLTAILLNAQAALRELDNPTTDPREMGDMLEDIVAQDKRAGDVIRRLRALLLRGAIEMQPVDVNECIREVLGLERNDLVAHHVIADLCLDTGLPSVAGDRVQLQQVLLNLVVNARDAMSEVEPGKRNLRIVSAVADDSIRVDISDTGTGILDAEAIFQPFFSTKNHGIGMGLAICRTIVTAHDGRLWATNNPGGGATFHLSIPLQKHDTGPTHSRPASIQ